MPALWHLTLEPIVIVKHLVSFFSSPTKRRWFLLLALALASLITLDLGCGKQRSRRPRSLVGARQVASKDSAFLLQTVASSLNNLAEEVVVELQPPVPILDDSKSADGQPVLATCSVTPAVPDGPYNYLFVPKGNANFRKLGVLPGDIVRYFVLVDEESVEHGIEQIEYIELTVRRLDEFNPENALIIEGGLNGPVDYPHRIEIWRFSDKRMNEIRQRITRYVQRPRTRIGWEPSPDESALVQLLDRVNQWLRNLNPEQDNWQPEPLVAELPSELRDSSALGGALSDSALAEGQFTENEPRQLQQAIWMRDVAKWAKGEAVSPLDVATALFDWTVRNIQRDADDQPQYVFQPWQALMYGHGTAEYRAWVFAELCRQQQLDIVMLSAGGKFWLPALLLENELYLFDTRLGLPIPGSEPGSVATLAEVKADASLLNSLDIDEQLTYPLAADDLESVNASLVASPLQLSRRARLLQDALESEDFVVLSANTRQVSEQLEKQENIDQVSLWTLPFDSVLGENSMSPAQRLLAAQRFLVFASRPRLWKARVLHFQGTKDVPLEDRNDPLAQPVLGHQQATALYQDPRIRPPEYLLEQVDATKRQIYETAKGDASYWLGLLSYDLGKLKPAEYWLDKLTLQAQPNGPWAAGARYNLARTLEAQAEFERAVELLESDASSPQRHGNLLRARQLTSVNSAE